MIDRGGKLTVRRQAKLLDPSRSSVYEALQEATQQVRAPEIFNTDQGIAVHQRRVDNALEGRRRCDQCGWQGSLAPKAHRPRFTRFAPQR
jgi:hypothetical protein